MGYTLATMRNSTKETRRNRKKDLWERIRKEIRRSELTESQANYLIKSLKSDIDELIEIGKIEGIQQGFNEAQDKLK